MKKILAFLLATLMLLSFAACDDKTDDPKKTGEEGKADAAKSIAQFDFTQYGKASVAITGAELITSEDDEKLLRVYYDYTNTDRVGVSPDSSLKFNPVMQGEEELDDTSIDEDDPAAIPEDGLESLTIQPGITARLTKLFEIDPDGGKISFKLYAMVGSWMYNPDQTTYLSFELDPKNLPGKPDKDLEYAKITDPKHTANAKTSGSFADLATPFEVAITGDFEVIPYESDDDENAKAIRIGLTYKNLYDSEMPAGVAIPMCAYQDGLSLDYGSDWYFEANEEDEAFNEDVPSGEEIRCNAVFILKGDSPVEFVVETPASDLVVGKVFKVK